MDLNVQAVSEAIFMQPWLGAAPASVLLQVVALVRLKGTLRSVALILAVTTGAVGSLRYCQKLWISDRHDQAASFRFFSLVSRSCCRPSMNGTPARTSGSKCALLRRRHRRCAMSSSL